VKKQIRIATGTKRKAKPHAIISDKVKDYGNDPYFVKKAKDWHLLSMTSKISQMFK